MVGSGKFVACPNFGYLSRMTKLDQSISTVFMIFLALIVPSSATAAMTSGSPWRVALAHDRNGKVQSGNISELVAAIRRGCQIRVGWGAHRAADPNQTIEHIATPTWVAVRNGAEVEIQLSDFVINLNVLGEPAADHPRRERFGGTERAVNWRANLKTDGSFNAVWYDGATGKFITRIPQRHPMKWFVDCEMGSAEPLFPAD